MYIEEIIWADSDKRSSRKRGNICQGSTQRVINFIR